MGMMAVFIMLIVVTVLWVFTYVDVCQFLKLHTFNIFHLLYVSFTSVGLLKEKSHRNTSTYVPISVFWWLFFFFFFKGWKCCLRFSYTSVWVEQFPTHLPVTQQRNEGVCSRRVVGIYLQLCSWRGPPRKKPQMAINRWWASVYIQSGTSLPVGLAGFSSAQLSWKY